MYVNTNVYNRELNVGSHDNYVQKQISPFLKGSEAQFQMEFPDLLCLKESCPDNLSMCERGQVVCQIILKHANCTFQELCCKGRLKCDVFCPHIFC